MIDVSDLVALAAEAKRRQGLRARGVSTFGDPTPDPAPELSARDANVLEKTEQLEVRKRFVVCGFTVYSLSQARASKQTPGIADQLFVHRVLPIALWWETKRQVGGVYSTAQLEFKADMERCGITCRGGDRYDAERYLVETGWARIGVGGAFEPIPSEAVR